MKCISGGRAVAALTFAAILYGAASARAQGNFGPVVVLRTGGSEPILSSTQFVGNFSATGPALLQFAFGFSTDEEQEPGVFLDSITLTLSEQNGPLSVIYNTTDRTGAYWAPAGGISISGDSITRETIGFPILEPSHAHQYAYLVTAPVPNELLGKNLNFYTDVFDNRNGTESLGWVSVVPIPEPATWAIAATMLVMIFAFQWRSR